MIIIMIITIIDQFYISQFDTNVIHTTLCISYVQINASNYTPTYRHT